MTWQFTIERELVLLLYEQVHSMATSPIRPVVFNPALAAAPVAPTIRGSQTLRQLILYDFEEWVKNSRRALTQNGAAIITEYQKVGNAMAASSALVAAAAATAPPPGGVVPPAPPAVTTLYHPALPAAAAAPNPNLPPETTFTHLFTMLGLKYSKWNCYEHGLGLFGELSSSIHKYDKQYEVDETNWGRSDFLILKWLQPTVDKHGQVDWDQIRAERNLPYSP
jgi:hypothetical protein